MPKTKKWKEIRAKKFTPEELAVIDAKVDREIIQMDLRAVRELVGKTQVDMAAATEMTQSEISRLERRTDLKVSTLKRYVEALGGELEVWAAIGDKRVRLRAVE